MSVYVECYRFCRSISIKKNNPRHNITKLKLQKEEVEEVMWMDQEELIQKVRDGGIPNCIYLDEVEKF